MYIVQIKNPDSFVWKELPATNCRFRSIEKAISLYKDIKNSLMYDRMETRIWQTEAQHRVIVDNID